MRRTLRAHSRRQIGSGTCYVPAAIRDAVWRRDEGRCAFVSEDGHRCGWTWQVEFHHIHPFGKGGPSTIENLMLACARHDGHLAERDFGTEHIARARGAEALG